MTTPKPGIALVAPGGYAPEPDAIARGIARLEAQGILVHNYYRHEERHQRFAATDAERLAQLEAAAFDPDVQVVMAIRGQYGMSRLLPDIDFERMAASGKIFVGYSDVTAFQMGLYAKTGVQSYAGPMFAGDFGAADPVSFTLDDFWQCLAGPTHAVSGHGAANPRLDVTGTVWGGNLAMIMSVMGTPYFPRIDGGILFLEDVNEHPYRVERMLYQLHHAGILARQRALILGDFIGGKLAPIDNGYDFSAMLEHIRTVTGVPIVTGLRFGHGSELVTLPFGARARLQADGDGFSLTVGGHPTLA